MKRLVMAHPKHPPAMASSDQPKAAETPSATAFDLWLQRSLHQLFDQVAKEPIPEALLRLIEQDRQK